MTTLLTPEQLSDRWEGRISVKTLANWRSKTPRRGPRFRRIGNRILYPLEAITDYEAESEVATFNPPAERRQNRRSKPDGIDENHTGSAGHGSQEVTPPPPRPRPPKVRGARISQRRQRRSK